MSRPEQTTIAQGSASWDAIMNEIMEILFDRVIPLPENYADASALETARPAADHGGCIATNTAFTKFFYSDGTDWLEVPIANSSGKIASSFLPAATDSVVGALETATTAELNARSATDKIVTPGNLSGIGRHRGLWEDHLTTDESETATSWAAIPNLSVAVTKAVDASKLKITASASVQNTTGAAQIRVKVDGVVVPAKGFGVVCNDGEPGSGSQVSVVTGKSAGSFNVTAEWQVDAGTVNCNASSDDDQGISIVVEEID